VSPSARSPSIDFESRSLALRTDARAADINAVRRIVESTGFFSDAEVAVAVELIEDRVSKGCRSDYRFVFLDRSNEPLGYACFGPIACTVGSFDLYWIAVHNDARGRGIGRQILAAAEQQIAQEGGRRVYVETSSRVQYEPTRQFYLRCGYQIEATLQDFYSQGDGKVILVKALIRQ